MSAKPVRTAPASTDQLQRMPSCTRCGKRDAVEIEEGIPARMCQECRDYMRQYQQTYRSGDEIRARAEGFKEGCEAMRDKLLGLLNDAHPNGRMLVHEVTAIVTAITPPERRPSNPVSNGQSGS